MESALLLMKVYRENKTLILLSVFSLQNSTCLDSTQFEPYMRREFMLELILKNIK